MEQPLGDRVIVEAIQEEEVTKGGIVLPENARERPQRGTVIAVGRGRVENGVLMPLEVAVGDVVIYSKYGGTEVKVDGTDVLILRETDILTRSNGTA